MADDAPGDRLRERADRSRTALWVMLEANRWHVVLALLGVLFVALVLAGALLPGAAGSLRASDSIDALFQALLTATITAVALVLTLNQLVLSQELGAVGDQRERMDGAMAFQADVADAIDEPVSPARPAQLLRALVTRAGEQARTLDAAVPEEAPMREAVSDLTDSVVENAERAAQGLDDARFGSFAVTSSALNFNYSWKLHTAARLQADHGDAMDDEASDALGGLVETLRLFGPAREHVKTLYFQWELVDLSRHILVAALPALVVSGSAVAFLDDGAFATTLAGVDALVVVVALATTVSLLPFAVLLAYVLRIATVAKRTLSIGPFILRETDAVDDRDWEQD
jgi:hypothetical protein